MAANSFTPALDTFANFLNSTSKHSLEQVTPVVLNYC